MAKKTVQHYLAESVWFSRSHKGLKSDPIATIRYDLSVTINSLLPSFLRNEERFACERAVLASSRVLTRLGKGGVKSQKLQALHKTAHTDDSTTNPTPQTIVNSIEKGLDYFITAYAHIIDARESDSPDDFARNYSQLSRQSKVILDFFEAVKKSGYNADAESREEGAEPIKNFDAWCEEKRKQLKDQLRLQAQPIFHEFLMNVDTRENIDRLHKVVRRHYDAVGDREVVQATLTKDLKILCEEMHKVYADPQGRVVDSRKLNALEAKLKKIEDDFKYYNIKKEDACLRAMDDGGERKFHEVQYEVPRGGDPDDPNAAHGWPVNDVGGPGYVDTTSLFARLCEVRGHMARLRLKAATHALFNEEDKLDVTPKRIAMARYHLAEADRYIQHYFDDHPDREHFYKAVGKKQAFIDCVDKQFYTIQRAAQRKVPLWRLIASKLPFIKRYVARNTSNLPKWRYWLARIPYVKFIAVIPQMLWAAVRAVVFQGGSWLVGKVGRGLGWVLGEAYRITGLHFVVHKIMDALPGNIRLRFEAIGDFINAERFENWLQDFRNYTLPTWEFSRLGSNRHVIAVQDMYDVMDVTDELNRLGLQDVEALAGVEDGTYIDVLYHELQKAAHFDAAELGERHGVVLRPFVALVAGIKQALRKAPEGASVVGDREIKIDEEAFVRATNLAFDKAKRVVEDARYLRAGRTLKEEKASNRFKQFFFFNFRRHNDRDERKLLRAQDALDDKLQKTEQVEMRTTLGNIEVGITRYEVKPNTRIEVPYVERDESLFDTGSRTASARKSSSNSWTELAESQHQTSQHEDEEEAPILQDTEERATTLNFDEQITRLHRERKRSEYQVASVRLMNTLRFISENPGIAWLHLAQSGLPFRSINPELDAEAFELLLWMKSRALGGLKIPGEKHETNIITGSSEQGVGILPTVYDRLMDTYLELEDKIETAIQSAALETDVVEVTEQFRAEVMRGQSPEVFASALKLFHAEVEQIWAEINRSGYQGAEPQQVKHAKKLVGRFMQAHGLKPKIEQRDVEVDEEHTDAFSSSLTKLADDRAFKATLNFSRAWIVQEERGKIHKFLGRIAKWASFGGILKVSLRENEERAKSDANGVRPLTSYIALKRLFDDHQAGKLKSSPYLRVYEGNEVILFEDDGEGNENVTFRLNDVTALREQLRHILNHAIENDADPVWRDLDIFKAKRDGTDVEIAEAIEREIDSTIRALLLEREPVNPDLDKRLRQRDKAELDAAAVTGTFIICQGEGFAAAMLSGFMIPIALGIIYPAAALVNFYLFGRTAKPLFRTLGLGLIFQSGDGREISNLSKVGMVVATIFSFGGSSALASLSFWSAQLALGALYNLIGTGLIAVVKITPFLVSGLVFNKIGVGTIAAVLGVLIGLPVLSSIAALFVSFPPLLLTVLIMIPTAVICIATVLIVGAAFEAGWKDFFCDNRVGKVRNYLRRHYGLPGWRNANLGDWVAHIMKCAVLTPFIGFGFVVAVTAVLATTAGYTKHAIFDVAEGLFAFGPKVALVFGAIIGTLAGANFLAFDLENCALFFKMIGETVISVGKFVGKGILWSAAQGVSGVVAGGFKYATSKTYRQEKPLSTRLNDWFGQREQMLAELGVNFCERIDKSMKDPHRDLDWLAIRLKRSVYLLAVVINGGGQGLGFGDAWSQTAISYLGYPQSIRSYTAQVAAFLNSDASNGRAVVGATGLPRYITAIKDVLTAAIDNAIRWLQNDKLVVNERTGELEKVKGFDYDDVAQADSAPEHGDDVTVVTLNDYEADESAQKSPYQKLEGVPVDSTELPLKALDKVMSYVKWSNIVSFIGSLLVNILTFNVSALRKPHKFDVVGDDRENCKVFKAKGLKARFRREEYAIQVTKKGDATEGSMSGAVSREHFALNMQRISRQGWKGSHHHYKPLDLNETARDYMIKLYGQHYKAADLKIQEDKLTVRSTKSNNGTTYLELIVPVQTPNGDEYRMMLRIKPGKNDYHVELREDLGKHFKPTIYSPKTIQDVAAAITEESQYTMALNIREAVSPEQFDQDVTVLLANELLLTNETDKSYKVLAGDLGVTDVLSEQTHYGKPKSGAASEEERLLVAEDAPLNRIAKGEGVEELKSHVYKYPGWVNKARKRACHLSLVVDSEAGDTYGHVFARIMHQEGPRGVFKATTKKHYIPLDLTKLGRDLLCDNFSLDRESALDWDVRILFDENFSISTDYKDNVGDFIIKFEMVNSRGNALKLKLRLIPDGDKLYFALCESSEEYPDYTVVNPTDTLQKRELIHKLRKACNEKSALAEEGTMDGTCYSDSAKSLQEAIQRVCHPEPRDGEERAEFESLVRELHQPLDGTIEFNKEGSDELVDVDGAELTTRLTRVGNRLICRQYVSTPAREDLSVAAQARHLKPFDINELVTSLWRDKFSVEGVIADALELTLVEVKFSPRGTIGNKYVIHVNDQLGNSYQVHLPFINAPFQDVFVAGSVCLVGKMIEAGLVERAGVTSLDKGRGTGEESSLEEVSDDSTLVTEGANDAEEVVLAPGSDEEECGSTRRTEGMNADQAAYDHPNAWQPTVCQGGETRHRSRIAKTLPLLNHGLYKPDMKTPVDDAKTKHGARRHGLFANKDQTKAAAVAPVAAFAKGAIVS